MILVTNFGAKGKMGQAIQQVAASQSLAKITVQVDQDNFTDSIEQVWSTDVIICFSSALGLKLLLEHAQEQKVLPVFVIGTTGIEPSEQALLERLASQTLVCQSANFSFGIALLQKILKTFNAQFSSYAAALLEIHHAFKQDMPSGTALQLAACLSQKVDIQAIRAGNIVGEHHLKFFGDYETLSFSHTAHDRKVFAQNAWNVGCLLAQKRSLWKPKKVLNLLDIMDLLV